MQDNLGFLDRLTVTVLIEDYAGYDCGLLAQHGISFFIEAVKNDYSKYILFDTGQDSYPLLENMKLLGADPEKIDLVVLSHGHYDHTGGLTGFLEAAGKINIPIIAHPDLFRPTFSLKPSFRSFGTGTECTPEIISSLGGELILTSETLSLMEGVVTSGEIDKKISYEKESTLSAFTLDEGKIMPDQFQDDLSLFFILSGGLVILTGCAHAGIINIVEQAVKITGIDRIAAVIGGFHLVSADKKRIDMTARNLQSRSESLVFAGHCTGLKAEAELLRKLGDRFNKLRTGLKIDF